MAEHAVQKDPDTAFFRFPAQPDKFFLRTQKRINFFIIAGIIMMVAAAFKNRVQIKTGDAQRLKIVQLFPDTLQRTAKKIIIKDVARIRVFDVTGPIVPASVQQRILFPAELGQRHTAPVKTVRKDLVHDSVLQPVRRFGLAVINGDLEGGRFFFAALPPASQLFPVVAVIKNFSCGFNFKIIPKQAALFRDCQPVYVFSFFSFLRSR